MMGRAEPGEGRPGETPELGREEPGESMPDSEEAWGGSRRLLSAEYWAQSANSISNQFPSIENFSFILYLTICVAVTAKVRNTRRSPVKESP